MKLNKNAIISLSALILMLTLSGAAAAGDAPAQDKDFHLTIDSIMEGPALVGTEPSQVMWSVSGEKIYFNWRQPGDTDDHFFEISLPDLEPKKIDLDAMLTDPPLPRAAFSFYGSFRPRIDGASIHYNDDKTMAAVSRNGDIFLLTLASGTIQRLTQTDARETDAGFTHDNKNLTFTRNNNLFVIDLNSYQIRQMTSFSREKPPAPEPPDDIDKWFRDQQLELFDIFKQQENQRTRRSREGENRRQPYFLEENEYIYGLDLSPDLTCAVFFLSQSNPEAKTTIVPDYVTRSGYTETMNAHAKAAHSSRSAKAGIMDCGTGEVTWVDYGMEERRISPSGIYWSPDGSRCVVSAQSEDRKDAWLFRLDVQSGKAVVAEHVHNDAWVHYLSLGNVVWWPDSRHFSYISEKSGYAHLYKFDWESGESRALTSGTFEVYQARLSQDKSLWYLNANKEHPGERHFYSMPADGGRMTRLTQLKGHNQAFLSPDESRLALIRSYVNQPPELYLQEKRAGAEAKRITVSPTQGFRSYDWAEPEVITFTARDGADVYARVYQPEKWHETKPAVIFIHGAGYLQNAHYGWSSYYREYMFHNFLMEKGYMVMDIDYRGSAGYGRNWRTGIYRHMGGKDLDDIVDGARFLTEEYGADPGRLGVYGGSYGGFLTFMAMFTTPDVFAAGAALRPVTDWAHYHNSYTQNILNLPQNDSEAYKQSSPIYFADGLKGALLICHGMIDTNVHFQDSVRLVQRLIELRKENWELAVYPAEGHGFRHPSSWADEYKRIFKLFEENLK
jgi:dipeptidyl aminopeptidase/acylaminoacyl peptidase